MNIYDIAYESYKQKCRELGLAPTSKAKIFAEDIVKKQNDDHINIVTLSKAKKQKAPVLSETAKEALAVKPPKVLKKRVAKVVEPKPEKVVNTKVVKAPKPINPKRVSISEKKQMLERTREWCKNNNKIVIPKQKVEKIEKPVKPKRVLLSEEEKKANARECARLYYEKNKDEINAIQQEKRKNNSKKVSLTDDEKKARQKEASRLYHLARKNDPAYQARRNANTREWNKKNKEKIAASNKKYRDEVRTPEQLEEKLAKAREYRQKNLEHMREKDRARKDQRREYLDNNPEARERRREYDRKRHAESMADASKAEKLREKWRKDGAKKRKKIT